MQQELEPPPILELVVERKLEPELELLPVELEVWQELELLLEPQLVELGG